VVGARAGDAVAPELDGSDDALGEAAGVDGGEGVPGVECGDLSDAGRVGLRLVVAVVVVPRGAAGTVSGAAGTLTYPPVGWGDGDVPVGVRWACRGAVLAEVAGVRALAGTAGGLSCRMVQVPPAAARAIAITARPAAVHRG
jgi:hypothetical protein